MLFRTIATALALVATPATATTLVPGTNALGGTTSSAEPNLVGVVKEDSLDPFSISDAFGTLSAVVQSRVVLSSDGTYDFYWAIRDVTYQALQAGGPALSLRSLRIGNFGNALGLNANFRTDGFGEVGPDTAYVFPDLPGFVNFNFSDPLAAGQSSRFMFLDTEATSYARSAALDLASVNGPISSLGSTFRPSSAVPEPATWALMILGFGVIGLTLRRRLRLPVDAEGALTRSDCTL